LVEPEANDAVRDVGWRSVVADRRRLLITAGSCLISAACLYYVLHRISLSAMVDSLSAARYGWLVPSTVLTIGTMWLRGVRWHAIFSDREAVTSAQCFAASSVGLMFNNLLPSRAGDVVRVFALRTASGVSAVEIGTTVVVERVLDVFVLGLFGLVLWPFLPDERWISALGAVCAIVVAVCAGGGLALALLRAPARGALRRRLARVRRIGPERAERLAAALSAGAAVLAEPRRLAWCVLLSAAVWGVAGLAALVLFPAFDLDAGTLAPWLLLVANSFALVVPSSPGTVGVYEASVQASLVAFGVSQATAVSLALVLHAVNFFPVIAVGAIAWWWLRRQGDG
jgi:glycosyltransferase 2 family protein